MKSKIPNRKNNQEERAVSPVIGVILMVAITVILAAVIAAFVLDIGPGDTDPQAAIDIDGDTTTEVSVTLQSQSQGDGIAVLPNDEDIAGDDDESYHLGKVEIGDEGEMIASTTTTGSSITVDGSEDGNVNDLDDGESYSFTVISYDGDDPEDLADDIRNDLNGDEFDSTDVIQELEDDSSVDIAVEDEFEVEIEED